MSEIAALEVLDERIERGEAVDPSEYARVSIAADMERRAIAIRERLQREAEEAQRDTARRAAADELRAALLPTLQQIALKVADALEVLPTKTTALSSGTLTVPLSSLLAESTYITRWLENSVPTEEIRDLRGQLDFWRDDLRPYRSVVGLNCEQEFDTLADLIARVLT